MIWFELSVAFHDDPKVIALRRRLGNPLADAWVSRVYAYAFKHEAAVFAGPHAVETIEHAAGWRGRPGRLVEALLAVGVLDPVPDGYGVHGVAPRLGRALAHRTAATERVRRWRQRENPQASTDGNSAGDAVRNGVGDSVGNAPTYLPTNQPTDQGSLPLAPLAAPEPVKSAKKAKAEKETDARHRPLVEALVAAYEAVRGVRYGFAGRDAKAVTQLLALSGGDAAEVVRRFRFALAMDRFPRCDSIADLAARWNSYSGTAPGVRRVIGEVSDFTDVPPDGFERELERKP